MSYGRLISLGALLAALLAILACTLRSSTVSIVLGGDVMLSRAGVGFYDQAEAADRPWGELYQIQDQLTESLFAVNLESPLGEFKQGLSEPELDMNLCAEERNAAILQHGSVDLVTLANNHELDCSEDIENGTLTLLEEEGIIGVSDQPSGSLQEWYGHQIAFFAIDDVSNPAVIEDYASEIKKSRETSELVVVSIHWGREYQAGPTQRQEDLAQALVNAGADVVWGHHPHVLQSMEWLSSVEDGHTGLVMYSLGNLLADQWMLPDTQRSVLVQLEYSDHKVTGITLIPLLSSMSTGKLTIPRGSEYKTWLTERLDLAGLKSPGIRITYWK